MIIVPAMMKVAVSMMMATIAEAVMKRALEVVMMMAIEVVVPDIECVRHEFYELSLNMQLGILLCLSQIVRIIK